MRKYRKKNKIQSLFYQISSFYFTFITIKKRVTKIIKFLFSIESNFYIFIFQNTAMNLSVVEPMDFNKV